MVTTRVFFSYRKQNANVIRLLAYWARASNIPVWFDEYNVPLTMPDGTELEGEVWRRHVEEAIRESDYIILFTNTAWLQSDACCWEFQIALDNHRSDKGRILQVCMPDERGLFTRCHQLKKWTPTHVWSSCEAFATFLYQHCGLTLHAHMAPDILTAMVGGWQRVPGYLTSIRLPCEVGANRGVSSDAQWPHRVMVARNIFSQEKAAPINLRVSENPYRTLLVDRLPQASFLSDRGRDEDLQRAYRELARSFFEKHNGFTWLGTHQFWIEDRCSFAFTYRIPAKHPLGSDSADLIERLYSIPWRGGNGELRGEVTLTFQMELPATAVDQVDVGHFALLSDVVAQTLSIPQGWKADARIDQIAWRTQCALVAAAFAFVGLFAILHSSVLSLACVLLGWLLGHAFAYMSFGWPYYRDAMRKIMISQSIWPFVFGIQWPIVVWALTARGWPTVLEHPIWCGVVGHILGLAHSEWISLLDRMKALRQSGSR